MRIGNRQFAPGLWSTLATLALLALFVRLGFWQLDRAGQKELRHAQFTQRQLGPALDLNDAGAVMMDKTELLWRNAGVRGRYANEHIVLDNQVVSELPGYFVYTPFLISGADKWVLVNRGWIPVGDDRSKLPDIAAPQEEMQISGAVSEAPPVGMVLDNAPIETMSSSVLRVQRIEYDRLSGMLRHELMPFTILLSPDADNGYVRKWMVPGSGSERNLGYALQWFSFAAILLCIYLVLNLKRAQAKV